MSNELLNRIIVNPQICHGKPVVRGLRYPVENILELLASGMTHEEILNDYEDLEAADLYACLYFAAQLGRNWIVSYEQGGIGYREHCFFISIDDKERFVVYEGMRGSKSIEDLKSAVENNTFLIEYWAKGDH